MSHDDVSAATGSGSALDMVSAWKQEIAAHPALAALAAWNARAAELGGRLSHASGRALCASLYAFNRATPAGIAQLAGRWADALMRTDPFSAHRIAATILESAVDEFGLAGTHPHLELFRAFAARWDVSPAEILDGAHAVPAARELGDNVDVWYRAAPLAEALAVHFVSEETSTAEFSAWFAIWPDADYTRVHAQLEPGHSNVAGVALAQHLAAHPEDTTAAHAAIEPYLALYRGMWVDLLARTARVGH